MAVSINFNISGSAIPPTHCHFLLINIPIKGSASPRFSLRLPISRSACDDFNLSLSLSVSHRSPAINRWRVWLQVQQIQRRRSQSDWWTISFVGLGDGRGADRLREDGLPADPRGRRLSVRLLGERPICGVPQSFVR